MSAKKEAQGSPSPTLEHVVLGGAPHSAHQRLLLLLLVLLLVLVLLVVCQLLLKVRGYGVGCHEGEALKLCGHTHAQGGLLLGGGGDDGHGGELCIKLGGVHGGHDLWDKGWGEAAVEEGIPVHGFEKGLALDVRGIPWATPQALGGVPLQQQHQDVLGLGGEVGGELQGSPADLFK